MNTAVSDSPSIFRNLRYRRILRFFGRMILHVIWWDLLVGRTPLLGGRARQTRPARMRAWAARFRVLAVQMGGVMIKLGQFLSARVDILPPEITEELQGLQDEVPAEPQAVIFDALRAQLGDLEQRFARLEETPLAAASLGQAHRAWLRPENGHGPLGQPVVVKVQRPNIEETVRVDLAALRVVAGWLMRYRPIRRRADAPALMDEFARTLWEELDYEAEAGNAERFARIHANDPRIRIPAVYREHSTACVLVLEDVEAIKISDLAAIRAAGIEPKQVADSLLAAYFQQIFEEDFFHADPHPGNLFVEPLGEGEWTPEAGPRPFRLSFIDFGMVGRVPNLVGDNLRKLLISVTRRDARQLTEAYQDLGFFLPGADLERITEAQAALLDRIWGRKLLDLAQPDPREVAEITAEFRDLLFDFPFQIPQDFIYLGRALGIISGLVSQLDPDINPWYQIEKYGEQLIRRQSAQELRDFSWETLLEGLRPYLDLPPRLLRLLEMAESGRVTVQRKTDRETLRRQERMERRIGQLGWSILGAAGMLSATLIYLNRNGTDHDLEK